MRFLNVDLTGLGNRPHPVLSGVNSAREVEKLRPAVKFLTGDYLTFDRQARDSGGEVRPDCIFCPGFAGQPPPRDTIEHVISQCLATSDARDRIMPELLSAVSLYYPENKIKSSVWNFTTLTQFTLNCTSLNLPSDCRFNVNDPNVSKIFAISRDLCYAIHSDRIKKLNQLR